VADGPIVLRSLRFGVPTLQIGWPGLFCRDLMFSMPDSLAFFASVAWEMASEADGASESLRVSLFERAQDFESGASVPESSQVRDGAGVPAARIGPGTR